MMRIKNIYIPDAPSLASREMYEISGFFLFEALRNSLELKRFEGRGFNTSGRYEKLEKCWITDERLWITIQPFYGR